MNDIVNRIAIRVKTAIGKALIKAVTDTDEIQLVKIAGISGEVQDGIERIQNYGMSSNPPVDSEAVAVCVGGSKDHTVVLAADSGAYRVTGLATGEVVVYSQFGQEILLKTDGSVEITAPAGVTVGSGTSPVALAIQTNAKFEAISNAINSAAVGTADGGAAFKANLIAALNISFPTIGDVDSSNLSAD
jgi:phage baseplate assembly protein V